MFITSSEYTLQLAKAHRAQQIRAAEQSRLAAQCKTSRKHRSPEHGRDTGREIHAVAQADHRRHGEATRAVVKVLTRTSLVVACAVTALAVFIPVNPFA